MKGRGREKGMEGKAWDYDHAKGKLIATDCGVRGLKRTVTCMGGNANVDAVYFGTTTGDIIEVGNDSNNLMSVGPQKLKFEKGLFVGIYFVF